MRPTIWQPPQNKSGIVFVLLWVIFSIFWLKEVLFSGLISGIFLIICAILLFKDPDKFAYRTFLFGGRHFDILFRQSQRYFAIALGVIAFIQILLPPSNLSISLMCITFFGITSIIASKYLVEIRQLHQKDIYITFTQKITSWLLLIGSSIFVIIGLMIIFAEITIK